MAVKEASIMKKEHRDLTLGIAIILLGVFALLLNYHMLRPNASLIGALVMLAVAWYFYQMRPHKSWNKPIAAFFFILSLLLLFKFLWPAADTFMGSLFLLAFFIAFTLVYSRDEKKWWAIIAAGLFFTLAVIEFTDQFDMLEGNQTAVVFFLGSGLTFLYLWLNHKSHFKGQWVLILSIILLFIAFFLFLEMFIKTLDVQFLMSFILVLIGIAMIIRALKTEKASK